LRGYIGWPILASFGCSLLSQNTEIAGMGNIGAGFLVTVAGAAVGTL